METRADPSASSVRYPRLRPGPGLSREIVAAHQQARLRQAMIELVAARGYGAVTVRALAKRARISTGTFYRHYSNTDDCLLCTFDQICGRASRRLIETGRSEPEPRRRLVLAIERLFQDMNATPEAAAFMLRAASTVGPAFTRDLWNSAMRLGPALEACLPGHRPPLHPLLLEGIIAGLVRIGGGLAPAAGEEEIRTAAAEAVEWVTGLCAPLPKAEAPAAVATNRPPAGGWEGGLGDERAMILAATFRIARSGYHQLSVSRVCREAGVSRRKFSRHFESLEECFVAAIEEPAARAIELAMRGRDASTTLRTLCEWVEEDRDSARVLFVEITAASTPGIDCRDRLVSRVADALPTTAPAAGASSAAAWTLLRRLALDENLTATEALPVLARLLTPKDKKRTVGDEKQLLPLLDFS